MVARASASRLRERRIRAGAAAAVAAATLAALLPPASPAGDQPNRYSLAGGCYSLAPAGGGERIAAATALRFQATRLGSYLLYGAGLAVVPREGAGAQSRFPDPQPERSASSIS
jgi:hypothetical protein